jgi:hypothetical protein
MNTTAETLTITRELRGDSAYWIHVVGPAGKLGLASRMAGAEARKWAKELGAAEGKRMRAQRVSSGGQYGSDKFRHSVCYGISAV